VIVISRLWLACFLILLSPTTPCFAQRQESRRPPPLDPVQGEREARTLVAEMLSRAPDRSSTNTGLVRIRQRDGAEREIPVRFEVIATPTNWLSIYENSNRSGKPGEMKLTVIHFDGAPNRYELLGPVEPGSTNTTTRELSGEQTMIPFVGSDFWVADLGLEFLHWSTQRVLRKEMRHSKSCSVLESINPDPVPGGYTRVESWIILDGTPGIVHADAYDARNEKLKEFDPVNLEKIQGEYQLEEVEMSNRQTGSRTWIKFHLPRE
jgi:hypothetical protein